MKLKLFAAALALAATPAFAHGDDKPRHGGQVVEVGDTVFELVKAPAGVTLYIMEDGDEVPTAAMTGKMIVSAGAKKTDVPLVAAGANRLAAKGAKVPDGARVSVMVIDSKTQVRQSAIFQTK